MIHRVWCPRPPGADQDHGARAARERERPLSVRRTELTWTATSFHNPWKYKPQQWGHRDFRKKLAVFSESINGESMNGEWTFHGSEEVTRLGRMLVTGDSLENWRWFSMGRNAGREEWELMSSLSFSDHYRHYHQTEASCQHGDTGGLGDCLQIFLQVDLTFWGFSL